jgi:hypothetical protein
MQRSFVVDCEPKHFDSSEEIVDGSSAFTPQIDFVATEFATQAMTAGEPGYSSNPTRIPSPCSYTDAASGSGNSNPCIQTIAQATPRQRRATGCWC